MAAHAYSDIADSVNAARDSVKNANLAAQNATELVSDKTKLFIVGNRKVEDFDNYILYVFSMQSNGIGNRAGESDLNSRELLENARQALGVVQTDLQPHINNATATVEKIQELNTRSDEKTTAINL